MFLLQPKKLQAVIGRPIEHLIRTNIPELDVELPTFIQMLELPWLMLLLLIHNILERARNKVFTDV
jgi:hypothetical protein